LFSSRSLIARVSWRSQNFSRKQCLVPLRLVRLNINLLRHRVTSITRAGIRGEAALSAAQRSNDNAAMQPVVSPRTRSV